MKDIEIYKVPTGRHYWLVRSKGGSLYDHFISSGVVGISHLDSKLESKDFVDDLYISDFEQKILFGQYKSLVDWAFPHKKIGEEKSANETSKKNQSKVFVNGISEGDWVVTVTDRSIRIGLVTSKAYVSKDALESELAPEMAEDSSYVRRDVDWGPEIPRHLVSAKMASKLRAQQTVVCLDDLMIDIHHYLFPIFIYDSTVYLSVNIGRPTDIPLDAMTDLFIQVNEYNRQIIAAGADPSTVKAFFFSEGQLRLKTVVGTGLLVIAALKYGYDFWSTLANGNEVTGVRPLRETLDNTFGNDEERNAKPLSRDLGTFETTTVTTTTTTSVSKFTKELESSPPYFDTSALRSKDQELGGMLFLGSALDDYSPESFD